MAAARPLIPLSPSFQHTLPSINPWMPCKPISDLMASSLPISLFRRQQGVVAVSVAFDPSGNFDISLQDEEDGKELCYVKASFSVKLHSEL